MSDEPLRRELSAFDATAVVIGAIIGVGIFFTPSRVAGLAGDGTLALATWGIGGAIALLGALTFAELGAMVPRAGGQYEVLRDAYGATTGFVYVICNATATQAGAIGVISLVCVDNLAVALTGGVLGPWSTLGSAIALTTGIALANAAGVRWGARIQNVTVVAKLATLAAVGAVAVWARPEIVAEASETGPRLHPVAGIAAALVPTLFSFGGWQQVLWLGGEVKEPERNLPISILVGVGVVVTGYLLVNWGYLALLGHAGVAGSQTLAADAVAVAFGDAGRRIIAVAVSVSALGILNAQLLTGPRLLYALALDGRLWPAIGRVHAGRGTPVAAIAVLAGMAIVLLVAAGKGGIDRLLTGAVVVDGVFFALTGLASVVLLRKHPRATRPVRMPGFPVVPLLFVLAEVGVVIGAWLDPEVRGAAAIGAGWIIATLVLYRLRFR